MKIIIMILTLLFIAQVSFAKETVNTNQETVQINDISWSEVNRVEKVKKIIGRVMILRMLGIVPASFWSEFGLDLDKDTLDWEKLDGIDIDMVLSAHEEMTNELEAKLNENGSTLGGEEFLRATIIASSLKILDYHIRDNKLLDENFEFILDKDLLNKIKDRIKILTGDRINPDDLTDGLPSNSDSTSEFTNGYRNRISDIASNFDPDEPMSSLSNLMNSLGHGEATNWSDVAGVGHDMSFGEVLLGILFYDAYETLRAEANGNHEEATTRGFGAIGNWLGESIYNFTHIDRNPEDGANNNVGSGNPTSKDLENIDNNSQTGNGTTYVEKNNFTKSELAIASKRIKVIKDQYGVICNESTGAGCNGGIGDFNTNRLDNGYTDPVEEF